MPYHMRRTDRQLESPEVIEEILGRGKYATIAFARNDEAYLATLSCGYDRDTHALYFHCAPEGLKTDFARANPEVCATIIEDLGYIPDECAHQFRSVVLRGTIEILTEDEDKRKALDVLYAQLEPHPEEMRAKLRDKIARFEAMRAWKLVITQATAKRGR